MRTFPEPVAPAVTIDWSKPVVIFDPWPFATDEIPLAAQDLYWLVDTGLQLRPANGVKSALFGFKYSNDASFLATATDGKLVLGKESRLSGAAR